LKKRIFSLPVVVALLVNGCDLFQTSLADYLRDFPAELRLDSLRAVHDAQIFYPLEALEPGRDAFTIMVTPKTGIGIALYASATDASSTINLPAPWLLPARPTPVVEGIQNYWKYRDNEEKQITVTAASGVSKTYTVTIVWAKLIDDPAEINGDLSQDYYLKPGPPLELSSGWLPIGAAADYASYTAFSGSLRGNGRTLRLRSFRPPSGYATEQGLFGKISQAWIEDLHVQLDGAISAGAKNTGGLAGTADESVIQRVKVSGVIRNTYSGTEANTGGITGSLAKTLIRNSISAVEVSGTLSYTGAGNAREHFYMGGITGSQVSGGYVFYSYASGTITALSPATVGGISGGGGAGSDTNIKGCVTVSPRLNALSSGRVNYILGQWDGPTMAAHNTGNYYYDQIDKTGTDAAPYYITGTAKTGGDLRQQSTYVSLGWDFTSVWKMNGYPALIWE
jgi:hypothetical protein